MTETIKEIKEVNNININHMYGNFSGYEVTTNRTKRYILIQEGQQCCENYGYMISEDDVNNYVGATLTKFSVVDKSLKVEDIRDGVDKVENAIFVNVETSKGTLQFTLYNEYNGYYRHDVVIYSPEIKLEGGL